jgi:hypothetical protein
MLSDEKMSEAEVSLRLAFYLVERRLVASDVAVAIDGAQVQTAGTVHFPMADFLNGYGCTRTEGLESWQGHYSLGVEHCVRIHSAPGQGDVVARLKTGHTLRVESKKGPLTRSKSSQEYPLLREALGQLLTIERVEPDDILAVAVPKSPKFDELVGRWRKAPLIHRFGIRLLTVGRDGSVDGLGPVPA